MNTEYDNQEFLTEQIITYIGNKRALLDFIGIAVEKIKKDLNKDKLDVVDIFSGSGIVARYLKKDAKTLITNDLENYSKTINDCYLSNKNEIDLDRLNKYYSELIEKTKEGLKPGFISELYAPKDSENIQKGERVFFTTRNAQYIDTVRSIIETFPKDIQPYFIAPLLSEVSIKSNTGGVFKGFYKNKETGIGQFGGSGKNALQRIMSEIKVPFPVFSDFSCKVINYQKDANELINELDEVDLIYMDPPYNQHPYGSNYFMLNVVNDYKVPEKISNVSGIPEGWNRSHYNQKREALNSMSHLCRNAKAKYLLISFNSEGFISKEEMIEMLNEIGEVEILEKKYNTYRASRNLKSRNIHVTEFLFIVRKKV